MHPPAKYAVVAWFALTVACATAPSGEPTAASPTVKPEGETWSAHGLTVARPEGWRFVPPDESLASDTVVALQGPRGEAALAPVVEIGRRPLSAADRRVNPEHILAATTVEFMQVLQSFSPEGEPQQITLGELPAAVMRAQITEMLPTGANEERRARFYATVHGEQVWLVRCLGPRDGSADPAFDEIVGSLNFAKP